MSAYVCEKNHFVYLACAMLSRRIMGRSSSFSYPFKGTRHSVTCTETDKAADLANILLRENIRSVSYRYGDKTSAKLPGPNGGVSPISPADLAACYTWDPVQVVMSVRCLMYQSCECPDWEQTEAFAILTSLKDDAVCAFPGMDDAAWGAPEPMANTVNLSALMGRKTRGIS
jgi:hypothetical protein